MPPPRRTKGQGHIRVSTPLLPGGWIEDGGDNGCPSSVGSRKIGPAPSRNDAHFHDRRGIVPQAYTPSEKLHLTYWDPRRLAAHVSATLFPEDRRAVAVDFILKKQIMGTFLARYTFDVDKLLSDEHCDIARDIARTIPRTFWVQWREPSSVGSGRYRLQEIVSDLRISPYMSSAESFHEKSNDCEEINVMTHPGRESSYHPRAPSPLSYSSPPPEAAPSELDEVFGESEGAIADPLSMWAPCEQFLAWMSECFCNSE